MSALIAPLDVLEVLGHVAPIGPEMRVLRVAHTSRGAGKPVAMGVSEGVWYSRQAKHPTAYKETRTTDPASPVLKRCPPLSVYSVFGSNPSNTIVPV